MKTNTFYKSLNTSVDLEKINATVHKITAWLLLITTGIAALNAILRYIGRYFNIALSSNIAIELQWYFFSIVFLFSGGIVFAKNKHIRVDVFYNKFSKYTQKIINIFGDFFLLLPLCVVVFWEGFQYFLISFAQLEQSADTEGLPRYYIKFFIPLCFLYLGINAILKKR